MAVSKQKKEEIIKDLREKFSRQKSVVFTDYKGFSVAEITDLRRRARAGGADYKVAKKTLIQKVIRDSNLEDFNIKSFEGQIGVVFGYDDEINAPRFAWKFSRKVDKLKILGGYLGASFLNKERVLSLAKLPGKQELRARMIGAINAPVSGFVKVLSENLFGLLRALQAIQKKKRE